MLDRCASVAVGAQPGGSNSTSSCAAGCSRICSGLEGPGCVQSTPGVCHSMPRAWKQRMRRATALTGPSGGSPRVRAESSSLLATLTAATATISALMAIARMMNSKATIMLTFQRCADGSPSLSAGKARKKVKKGTCCGTRKFGHRMTHSFSREAGGPVSRLTELRVPAGSGWRSRRRAHSAAETRASAASCSAR